MFPKFSYYSFPLLQHDQTFQHGSIDSAVVKKTAWLKFSVGIWKCESDELPLDVLSRLDPFPLTPLKPTHYVHRRFF